MDNVNNNSSSGTSTTTTNSAPSAAINSQPQPQPSTTPQQQQQQFCLRWHNHQTSLLSSLPILLDQSHLTDVTISTEGKTLKAHRVVLSACSSFFSELFRTLDSTNHPVIVIPGNSFNAMVALLTFMYSGEVNVYEGQIPTLLSLAETLGIKGLADFQNNLNNQNSSNNYLKDEDNNYPNKDTDTPSPTPSTPTNISSSKLPSPLENFFMKSLQYYPNLIPQPLNFTQSALNKTNELIAKYQQQCNLFQSSKDEDVENIHKRNASGEKKFCKDTRKIDKIAENLRSGNGPKEDSSNVKLPMNLTHPTLMKQSVYSQQPYMLDEKPKSADAILEHSANMQHQQPHFPITDGISQMVGVGTGENNILEKTITNPQTKTANSKLYATCFICHKQLSNQYNLRVHLETHQNVRYACNVCSHVSRSKDALRKHVSYRHPGAPSPCESEARRKRAKALSQQQQQLPARSTFPNMTDNQFLFMQNQFNTTNQQLMGLSPPQPNTAPSPLIASLQQQSTPPNANNNSETTIIDIKREADVENASTSH